MKMKSTIATLVLTLLAASVWGAGSAEPAGTEDSRENEEVTINYYTRPQEEGMEDAIIENFEREFPNIDVNRVEMPDDAELETLNTRLQAGDASVDVFASDVIWPPIFIRAGWVIPITEYIDEAQIRGQFLPGPIQAFSAGDEIYGVPFLMGGGMLFYRGDLLDEYDRSVPATWQELIETSQFIVAEEGNSNLHGYVSGWQPSEGLAAETYEFYWSEGGSIIGDDGGSVIDIDTLESALTRMREMVESDTLTPDAMTTFGGDERRGAFMDGNAIFTRDWGSSYNRFTDPERSEGGNSVRVAPLPGKQASLGGWGLMISAFSEHPEAAATFIEYATNFESASIRFERSGRLPTRPDVYETFEISDRLPAMEVTRPRPQTPFYGELSSIFQVETHRVITGRATPRDGAETIARKIEELLNLDSD